jgi:hypothetical protein
MTGLLPELRCESGVELVYFSYGLFGAPKVPLFLFEDSACVTGCASHSTAGPFRAWRASAFCGKQLRVDQSCAFPWDGPLRFEAGNQSCWLMHLTADSTQMTTAANRRNNKCMDRGLWIDHEVLARHLQSSAARLSHANDRHTDTNNRLLQLADLALAEKNRFDND